MNNPQDQKKRQQQALIFIIAGALLLAAAGFLLTRESSDSTPLAAESVINTNLPYPEVPRITIDDTKSRFEAGTVIFLDVRSEEEYADAHIPNAISMPFSQIEQRFSELPIGSEILTYCT